MGGQYHRSEVLGNRSMAARRFSSGRVAGRRGHQTSPAPHAALAAGAACLRAVIDGKDHLEVKVEQNVIKRFTRSPTPVDEQLGGRLDYGQPLFVLPLLVSSV
jgi:hypothetical protein